MNIRQALWAELVAKNYMEGLRLQSKCNQAVILENRLPILERVLKLPWAGKTGVLDTSKCDAAVDKWRIYEEKRALYHKIVKLGLGSNID